MIRSPQPDLPLFRTVPDNPNVRWLEELLQGAGCWMTCQDIMLTVHGRLVDRDVRSLASASEWIISGQKGYRHIKHASAEEIQHAAAWMESQAKKMSERACMIRRNGHRIIS